MLQKIVSSIGARIGLFLLGIFVAVIGPLDPKGVIRALQYAILKDATKSLNCNDC